MNLAAEGVEVVDLFLVGGWSLHVDSGNLLGAHGIGADGHVHAGVTGTDDHYPATDLGVFASVDFFEEIQTLDQSFMAGEGDDHRVVGTTGDYHCIGLGANAFKVALLDFLTG